MLAWTLKCPLPLFLRCNIDVAQTWCIYLVWWVKEDLKFSCILYFSSAVCMQLIVLYVCLCVCLFVRIWKLLSCTVRGFLVLFNYSKFYLSFHRLWHMDGSRVIEISEIENEGSYVASGQERFKKVAYGINGPLDPSSPRLKKWVLDSIIEKIQYVCKILVTMVAYFTYMGIIKINIKVCHDLCTVSSDFLCGKSSKRPDRCFVSNLGTANCNDKIFMKVLTN